MKQRLAILSIIAVVAVISVSALAQSGGTATDAYTSLKVEIESIGSQIQTTKGADEKQGLIREIETLLLGFRDSYPGTPEAADAAFQLGVMKQQMGDNANAAAFLSEYILKSGSADRNQIAFAHYYLAEAYKGAGKMDDARASYQTVLNDFGDANPRLTQAVQTSIAGLATASKLAIGGEPISFAVKGTKGESISPSEYKGKVLLLDFWATWCGPCVAEMPNVKKAYAKYKDKGFEVVGISLDRQRTALDKYVASNNIEWPQYFDGKYWQNDVAVQYGIKSIPATFLIDKKGKIRYKSLRGKQLEVAIQQLLAE